MYIADKNDKALRSDDSSLMDIHTFALWQALSSVRVQGLGFRVCSLEFFPDITLPETNCQGGVGPARAGRASSCQ